MTGTFERILWKSFFYKRLYIVVFNKNNAILENSINYKDAHVLFYFQMLMKYNSEMLITFMR